MIQSIYTSISNANLTPCEHKGQHITSDPIPLLRENYLSEYRTKLEKAKVRKNLGIKDDLIISWGLLEGTIEKQEDLVKYVEQKWQYLSDLDKDIHTVELALDYVIAYVKTFKSEADNIEVIFTQIKSIKNNIDTLVKTDIKNNTDAITTINDNITAINNSITELNENLKTINVDKNIVEWVKAALTESKTIKLSESNTLDVILSAEKNNAAQIKKDGLYTPDLTLDIINSTKYQTLLSENMTSPDKIGGIELGTTVKQLKGKTITEILDFILFPTFVRDLIEPQVEYSITSSLVEVGTPLLTPVLSFIQNDAGTEVSRNESISFNETPVEVLTYDKIGTFIHKGTVEYNAGEYLLDNKGEPSNKRIEAGNKTAICTVTATYPWYAGNTVSTTKLELVPFDISTEINMNLSGQAVIKIPGTLSTINLEVNGGLGFLEVDWDSWEQSEELLNNVSYKVYKKKKEDAYTSSMPHKITFKLIL